MSLHPTQRAREKILLAGPWGSGKSHARNRLIHTLNATGSTATVRVLDTDDTKDRAWDAYGDTFMERVEWQYVNSYEDWKDTAEKFAKDTEKDDWIVPDRVDLLWPAAEDYFIRQVYGTDSSDFYLQFAVDLEQNPRYNRDGKQITEGSPLAGAHGQRWGHINRQYAEVIANLVFPRTEMKGRSYGHPGHVLACANVKPLNAENESEMMKRDFQRFGVKPAGQKELPAQFHSVLMMSSGPPWVMNTAREREGREYVSGADVGDFVLSYLVGVGGWRLD